MRRINVALRHSMADSVVAKHFRSRGKSGRNTRHPNPARMTHKRHPAKPLLDHLVGAGDDKYSRTFARS